MMYLGISPPHPSMFLKNLVYKKYGFYKESYKIAADFEFYLRIFIKNKINYKLTDNTYVIMNYGGASTNSFKSNLIATKEINKSFKENDIYNNWIIILLRLPIKILQLYAGILNFTVAAVTGEKLATLQIRVNDLTKMAVSIHPADHSSWS